MKRDHYIQLIYKYFKGESSSKEKIELEGWLDVSEENRILKNKIEQDWKLSEQYSPDLNIDVKADFDLLQQRIRTQKAKQNTEPPIRSINSRRQWFAVAAAIALAIVAGWWLTNNANKVIEQSMQIAQTSIGEKREIMLADGSKVWLNENSRLTFPTSFLASQRKVELEGEAFFEIEKNPDVPFIIEMTEANVIVLGTSFNINARAENPVLTVTVRTGKVRLQSNQNKEALILIKGEKGLLDVKDHVFEKQKKADLNDFAWQTGVLRFRNQTLGKAIDIINDFYKGEAIFTQASMRACLFDGRLQEENLKGALEYIADAFEMTLIQKTETRFELSNGVCQ